jgi:hypothetical protein
MAKQLTDQAAILGLPQHDTSLPTAAKEAVWAAVRKVQHAFAMMLHLMHDSISIDIKDVDAGVERRSDETHLFHVLHLEIRGRLNY